MMLALENVHAFYGKSHILHGVSLNVEGGEIASLLGRNGAGKTTTLKTITGIVLAREGHVRFAGQPIERKPTHTIARLGIALVPDHRGIFRTLSVEENLAIALRAESAWTLADVFTHFPRLRERRQSAGGTLSGGEQQMLAIARALVNAPKLLLLDEPTEGLAPVIVDELASIVAAIRTRGIGVLLVEQNLGFCMRLADRHYVLEQGRIVYSGTRAEFRDAENIRDRYLTLQAAGRP
ncbi:MAG: ABC transporter ATP-binding protein [Acetobacteraceae bacterium]